MGEGVVDSGDGIDVRVMVGEVVVGSVGLAYKGRYVLVLKQPTNDTLGLSTRITPVQYGVLLSELCSKRLISAESKQ